MYTKHVMEIKKFIKTFSKLIVIIFGLLRCRNRIKISEMRPTASYQIGQVLRRYTDPNQAEWLKKLVIDNTNTKVSELPEAIGTYLYATFNPFVKILFFVLQRWQARLWQSIFPK